MTTQNRFQHETYNTLQEYKVKPKREPNLIPSLFLLGRRLLGISCLTSELSSLFHSVNRCGQGT